MTEAQINYGHVLLVEDDVSLAKLTANYLRQQGYQVSLVHNGNDAVAQILALKPDCILLDIMLPGTDGVEICRQIRSSFFGPIIFLTAKSDSIDEIMGLEIGGDDYLIKPVDPRKLLARIRSHLRRYATSQQTTNQKDDSWHLVLDMQRSTLLINDQPTVLSQPEFKLLNLFISRNGEPLNRDQIMMELRGIEHDGLNRTVDIHVSNLRKKLPDPEFIKTRRGLGYVWAGPEVTIR